MISAFVLEQNRVPLNPFTNWDYFLEDMVNRDLIIQANNHFVHISDELWQFGIISNGCYHEIKLAMEEKKTIRFFKIGKKIEDIKEIDLDDLTFEDELMREFDMTKFLEELKRYKQSEIK